MALAPDFNNLPKCLTDAWRIDRDNIYLDEPNHFEGSEELRSWSVSSLITLFLRPSEDRPSTSDESSHSNPNGDDNDSISAPEVSDDPRRILAAFRGSLMHGEVPYVKLRRLMVLRGTEGDSVDRDAAVNPDIDAAILNGEIHFRARGSENRDGKFLVSLPELLEILCPRTAPEWIPINPGTIVYQRQQPVEAAIKVLDELRPSALPLHVSDQSFAATFARITKNILNGLSWQNVVVAGGMVLTTLLHTDPARDQEKRVQDPDLDLYIYGLSPADAEKKAFEIEEIWRRNLPDDNSQIVVTKNHKTITFIASYPNRRLQIILKALSNPTAILLNFDLDICALAFDGSNVLMLPRCARAIETGYSMFTMDLIWGSHLSDRRSTQISRVLKYADRGFGIRFLPSYENLLKVSCTLEELPWCSEEALEDVNLEQIASMAQKYVADEVIKFESIAQWFRNPPSKITIDADGLGMRFPTGGRKGMDDFELFMRRCVAWRMDARQEIIFRRAGSDGSYDPALYDETPAYRWDDSFNTQALTRAIDDAATELSTAVQKILENPWVLPVEPLPGLHLGCQVYGPDLRSVLQRPLVVPVLMPHISVAIGDLRIEPRTQSTPPSSAILIHMQSRLRDTLVGKSQDWDLKYWYVDGAAMWEGVDGFWDEVTEVMWSLHKWFKAASHIHYKTKGSMAWQASCGVLEVARRYRRRFILPEVPPTHPTSTARLSEGLPTLRESLLFRAWVKRIPPRSKRSPRWVVEALDRLERVPKRCPE